MGGSKLVKSNLPRSKFPFIWGGCQGWSSQICLDLNFPLFWGGSKLVKSNLPRSKFPFIWGGCQGWSSQICLDLNFPLFFLGGVPRFLSTYIHTHDRLDKLRSALAEAQLITGHLVPIYLTPSLF